MRGVVVSFLQPPAYVTIACAVLTALAWSLVPLAAGTMWFATLAFVFLGCAVGLSGLMVIGCRALVRRRPRPSRLSRPPDG